MNGHHNSLDLTHLDYYCIWDILQHLVIRRPTTSACKCRLQDFKETIKNKWKEVTIETVRKSISLHNGNKNLAIANRSRKLRTQYVEGIYRHKYYTVTFKSRLRVT